MTAKVDIAKLYYERSCSITDQIIVYQPSVAEVIEYGEDEFWHLVSAFCANTTVMKLPLYEVGIYWDEFSDFELFASLVSVFTPEKTKIIFGDLDFTKFKLVEISESQTDSEENKRLVMVNIDNPLIQIDEEVYELLVEHLRLMFDYHPKRVIPYNKATRDDMIMEEQITKRTNDRLREQGKLKEEKNKSTMLSLLSFALNHPGFKYKRNELNQVGIFEFMDSIRRLQNNESTLSLMRGMYSGFIDTSQIKSSDLNLLRDLYE